VGTICTQAVFDAWIAAEGKAGVLCAAAEEDSARWRLLA
jgi:hypothetical protein